MRLMLGRTSSIRGSIGDVAMMDEMLVGGIESAGNGISSTSLSAVLDCSVIRNVSLDDQALLSQPREPQRFIAG